MLKGFGAEKFFIDQQNGEIKVTNCEGVGCVDYETQSTYSLTINAVDGGQKHSSASLIIEVIDINDHYPVFQKNKYYRDVFENDEVIAPPLIIKATDNDGPTQGGGINGIRYYIKSTNLTGLNIDHKSGEIKLNKSISHSLKRDYQARRKVHFEAIIKAIDTGKPPLSSEVKLVINVKSERDGAPVFISEPYKAYVKENAQSGTVIYQVQATDPDGPDSEIRYSIANGAKDNFLVEPSTGEIYVGPEANLDRDIYGSHYTLTLHATDSSAPVPLTSSAIVQVIVQDVNNKPPQFEADSYEKYLSEDEISVGKELLAVRAFDPDETSQIRYAIIEDRIFARDKAGFLIHQQSTPLKGMFGIESSVGSISLQKMLDTTKYSVIVLPILARDMHANELEEDGDIQQIAIVEVSIYIKSNSGKQPLFAAPWTPKNPSYEIFVLEEIPVGTTLLTLSAIDPVTKLAVSKFEKLKSSDPENIVSVSPISGIVTLNKRIDYEELKTKQVKFAVKAIGEKEDLTSVANIIMNIQDISKYLYLDLYSINTATTFFSYQ